MSITALVFFLAGIVALLTSGSILYEHKKRLRDRPADIQRDIKVVKQIKKEVNSDLRSQFYPSLRTCWMVWLASALHFWWGIILTFLPPGESDLDSHGGVAWNIFYELSPTYEQWGIIMIISAILALLAGFVKRFELRLMMVLPQQFVLVIGAIGAIGAIGHLFGWGHEYEFTHILRIFPMQFFLAFFHTMALLDHFAPQILGKYRYDERKD